MKLADVRRNPSYFDTYMSKVDDLDLADAFRKSLTDIDSLGLDALLALGDQVYAPGKWTARDLIQHVTDTERVFAYRALRFARNDRTELPGFDEGLFAEYSGVSRRPMEEVLAELKAVRESTRLLFHSFEETALRRTGVMYGAELPVLAIGFTAVGHQNHHFNILKERYFPLLATA